MSQIRHFLITVFVTGALASAFLHASAAEAGTERVIYSFCSQQNCADGSGPEAGLTNVHGLLYGTTYVGGANGEGTVFSVDPKNGAEVVVHAFQNHGTDGSYPEAGLINVRGTLYGTTTNGGTGQGLSCCYGTVFSIDPKTEAETVLYSFCSQGGSQCSDGARPRAGLINAGGILYGTAEMGGVNETCGLNMGCGTVFALNPETGSETLLHTFQYSDTDGSTPYGGLISDHGILYGTTVGGGGAEYCNDYGCGSVFSVDPKTGAEAVVHAFCGDEQHCTDGENPWAGMINVGGILYGTTGNGGTNDYDKSLAGTVFSFNPKTGAETLVYSFCSLKNCADGTGPAGALIDIGGVLYGTTIAGGNSSNKCSGVGCGTVFSVDPKTGTEEVLYSFCGQQSSQQNCPDGYDPAAGLINLGGVLYGTTRWGGANNKGTVFAVTP